MAWTPLSNVTNGTFEIQTDGQSFVPDGWAVNSAASMWKYAAFEGYEKTGVETFEAGFANIPEQPILGWRHKRPDPSDMDAQDVSDLTAAIATANYVKTVANDHFGSTVFHVAADPRTIAAADATDLASLITLVNELYDDTKAHAEDASLTWHRYWTNFWDVPITTPSASDLPSAQLRLAVVVIFFGRHLFWAGNEHPWSAFNETALDLQTYDGTDVYLDLAGFDAAEYDAERFEDMEEGWESEYLDPGVQASLGKNEDYETELVPTLAAFAQGDDFESFEAGWTWRHKVADATDMDNRDISTLGEAVDTANYVKAVASAHFPSTSYHLVADPRTIAAADASDLASLITLVNELYTDTKAHAEDSGATWHRNDPDDLDVPIYENYPATDLPSAQTLLAIVLVTFAKHLWWRGNDHIWTELTAPDFSDLDATTKLYVKNAEFDAGTTQEYENFEEEWNSNEDTYDSFTIPTNLQLATFESLGNPYESFELTRPFTNISTSNGGISDELSLDPNKAFYFEATFTGNATYRLQCQRSIGGAWISILEFTATTALEVPEGYRAARIYTVNHTTGSLVASVGWERLDIY